MVRRRSAKTTKLRCSQLKATSQARQPCQPEPAKACCHRWKEPESQHFPANEDNKILAAIFRSSQPNIAATTRSGHRQDNSVRQSSQPNLAADKKTATQVSLLRFGAAIQKLCAFRSSQPSLTGAFDNGHSNIAAANESRHSNTISVDKATSQISQLRCRTAGQASLPAQEWSVQTRSCQESDQPNITAAFDMAEQTTLAPPK